MKAKFTVLVECEMSVSDDCYPDGSSFEDMVRIEQYQFNDDPVFLIDTMIENGGELKLTIDEV